MGMSDLPDVYAQSPRATGIHIGKSRVPMLQLICNTSVQADRLDANMSNNNWIHSICMPERFDYS